MSRTFTAALALIAALVAGRAVADDNASRVIDEASKAMGVVGLNSLTYGGAAALGNFGQSRTITFGLASTAIRNYIRTIDFAQPALRSSGDSQPPALVRGGPLPPPGKYNQIVNAATPAWSQQMEILMTPWGFLKGAAANHATLKSTKVNGVP